MSKTEERYSANALISWATALLQRAGLAHDRAGVVAETLVEGDLMGHTTHGLQLLAPYLKNIEAGTMTKDGDTYYHNMTIATADEYTYHIWANDTSDNKNTSTPISFNKPSNPDVNMDGCVHFMDLVAVSLMYNDEGADGWVREDVNNDGKAHFMDLVAISLDYNECWRESSSGTPGAGDTNVSIYPANQTVEVNESFTVSIYVEPDEKINGVSIDYLYFNASLVHANSVTEGDLFDPYSTLFSAGTIDNVKGMITDIYGLTIPLTNTVTANGYFCNISFTAQQEIGLSDLNLDGVLVSDEDGESADITVFDGTVTVEQ